MNQINNNNTDQTNSETETAEQLLAEYNNSAQTDKEVLRELELGMPANLLTEDIPIWNEFLKILISGYASNIFEKDYATQLYQAFMETEKNERRTVLDKLHNLLEESIQITETNKIVYTQEIVEGKIQKILPMLSPEEQATFLESIDLGQVPDEVQSKLAMMNEPVITPEEAEIYAEYRLQNALDRRNQLKASDLDGVQTRKFNTTLTTEEVKAVVDQAEQVGQPTLNIQNSINPINSTPNTNIPSNSGYIPTPQPPRTLRPPNSATTTPNIPRTQKAATLDQLLHANDVDQK
ncbi:MAG: hypothetical protein AAGF07_03280 [Patescibacteria group bacterium]